MLYIYKTDYVQFIMSQEDIIKINTTIQIYMLSM